VRVFEVRLIETFDLPIAMGSLYPFSIAVTSSISVSPISSS